MTRILTLVLFLAACHFPVGADDLRARPFALQVVDEATGRGVPLVEVETVNSIRYVTDSAGYVAFEEPGMMGRDVFFSVKSHGYELPKDGFGYRGRRLRVEPGGQGTIKIKRINIAERLYRVTGQGIYRDSVLLGKPTPLAEPLLNSRVTGQDSVVNAVYRGKLYWFYGDTNQEAYPLGNYQVTGAVSDLPGRGGLDPLLGVNLNYLSDEKGFTRQLCPIEGPGPVWIFGAMVVPHEGGEMMVTHYDKVAGVGKRIKHGMAVWNDSTQRFDVRVEFPLDAPLYPRGNPTRVKDEQGVEWYYFCTPYPFIRVRADLQDVLDYRKYEAWTCLKPGSREKTAQNIERDAEGRAVWGWKADAPVVSQGNPFSESSDPDLKGTAYLTLRDAETGKPIRGHGGTVSWNDYRQKWVMVALETWGKSMLGEVWYAEAEALGGPWVHARKIVTHDKYSFYNIKQHPYFDQENGRYIYFEGTYTTFVSGNDHPTPRYDYNQIMYRLDLADERLQMPQADVQAPPGSAQLFDTTLQPVK